MSDVVISPNMMLPVPIVGQDPGPDWANNINSCLGILDQHNHSSGQGVQITPNGLNINSDLPLNSNNLTSVNTVRFNNLSGTIAGIAPNLGIVYEANNNLYFNDGVGNIVQITSAGAVNATSSGISSGTATASFVGGVLVVDSNVNTPANVQCGSVLLGNNTAASNFATLQPPNALGANYSLTLPPINGSGGSAFLTYDTSNNMGVGPAVTGGITTSNIASQSITQSLLAPRPTGTTVSAGGIGVQTLPNNTYTNSSFAPISGDIVITTTGRPVMLRLEPTPASQAYIQILGATGANNNLQFILAFYNSTTASYVGTFEVDVIFPTTGSNGVNYPPSAFSFLDRTVNGLAGTYTYNIQLEVSSGTHAAFVNTDFVAYEI